MKREKNPPGLPVALSIGGSDSGGAAGIQADLKTFAALNVHGTTAITCLTAQNPEKVIDVYPCSSSSLRNQLMALFEELPPAAIKTGMLYSARLIGAASDALGRHRAPVVVDPVMVSTSGSRLLKPNAIKALCQRLLPLATLVTPNLHEAECLLRTEILSVEDMRQAGKALYRRFKIAVLVKGGHLRGLREAVDIFYDGKDELLLSAPFVRGVKTHGTGCTYSAAITAYLARGSSLAESVIAAKQFVTQAIAQRRTAAGHDVLNSFWR